MSAVGHMTRRARVALGVPTALAVVLGVEVGVALAGEYLADVDWLVDRVVTPGGAATGPTTAAGSTTASGGDARQRALRLWVLGDSTAAGVGAATEDGALPVQIAQRVARATGRAVHVTGLGVSGARTDDVRTEQVPTLPPDGVDAVVIAIGSNDVTHVTAPRTLAHRTRAMLEAVRDRCGAPVILAGIPRFAGARAIPQPLRGVTDRYAGILRTAQERGAAEVRGALFVDISTLASPRFIGRPDAMSADAFHPSEVGYGFWADALAPQVTVLARQSSG